jgi:hypothetical protein
VHNDDYSFTETVTILGFDPVNVNTMLISPLSIAPPVGYIVDCASYPTTTNPADQQKSKLLFCFLNPTLTVTSGTSAFVFDVSLSDAALIPPSALILVRNLDYTTVSPRVNVVSVVGTTVTVDVSLGFTPQAGDLVELVGFADFSYETGSGGAYLIL